MVQGEAEPPVVVEARSICLLPLGLRHRSLTTLTEAGMPCSGISPSCRVRRELLRLTRLSSILGVCGTLCCALVSGKKLELEMCIHGLAR